MKKLFVAIAEQYRATEAAFQMFLVNGLLKI